MHQSNSKLSYEAFLQEIKVNKKINKSLVDVFVERVGNWNSVCTLADTCNSMSISEVPEFNNDRLLVDFYSKNKELFLEFLQAQSSFYDDHNLVLWVRNKIAYNSEKALNDYAYALYDPKSAVNSDSPEIREATLECLSFVCHHAILVIMDTILKASSRSKVDGVSELLIEHLEQQNKKINPFSLNRDKQEQEVISLESYSLVNQDLMKAAVKFVGAETLANIAKGNINTYEVEILNTHHECVGFFRDNLIDMNDFIAKYAAFNGLKSNIDAVRKILSEQSINIGFDETAKALYEISLKNKTLCDLHRKIIRSVVETIYKEIRKIYIEKTENK